ncbi:hypothetical protein ACFCWG_30300 [Streptomyces sp. NPDC056390]|uniref:hypothetical protein n=1 Tax=Streptomyces sp. NPDC056390 TaxID=3345806 RepID=UPI0035E016D3
MVQLTDQAAHRTIGIGAALVTTWITLSKDGRRWPSTRRRWRPPRSPSDKLRNLALGDTADLKDQDQVLEVLYDHAHPEDSVLVMQANLLSDLATGLDDRGAEHTTAHVGEGASCVTDGAVRIHATREETAQGSAIWPARRRWPGQAL